MTVNVYNVSLVMYV